MEEISKKVLTKIKKEEIKPVSRLSFLLKNSSIWTLFGISIIFGSVGFSIVLFMLERTDISAFLSSVNSPIKLIFISIPLLWVSLTTLSLMLGYINFRNTKRGYRFEFIKVFLLNILSVVLLGSLLHLAGVSFIFNTLFEKNIPFYTQVADSRYAVWNRPQEGFLAGKIARIEEEGENMLIISLDNEEYTVLYSEARIRPLVNIEVGEIIKVRGELVGKRSFKASDIMPWDGRRRHMQEISK